jgi:hypothetical protein
MRFPSTPFASEAYGSEPTMEDHRSLTLSALDVITRLPAGIGTRPAVAGIAAGVRARGETAGRGED